jgi:ribonuclease-3 family protein
VFLSESRYNRRKLKIKECDAMKTVRMLPALPARLDENPPDVSMLSPLVLAFVGDAVQEVYVRTALVMGARATAHTLHRQAVKFVSAAAQAKIAAAMMDFFDEEEQEVFRKGRNAKPARIPKNANIEDYHAATAFEAVLGYRYLKNDDDRLEALLEKMVCLVLEG